MSSAEQSHPPEWASGLLELATADPVEAQREARERLDGAQRDGDAAAWCLALRVLGHAAREMSRPAEALRHLQQSVEVGEAAGLLELAAGARVTLALTHFSAGDSGRALAEVDRALEVLHGVERARAVVQRALIHHRMGQFPDALDGYSAALPVLQAAGDRVWLARLHNNRGLLHMGHGRLREAEQDLRHAERQYHATGQRMLAVQAVHNRGCVASLAGEFPRALRLFEEADRGLIEMGCPTPATLPDFCRALLSVRLLDDAREVAVRGVRELSTAGMTADLAEARLLLSQVALLQSDFPTAKAAAGAAMAAFGEQERSGWRLAAQHQAVRVAWAAGERSSELLERTRRLAAQLDAEGWVVESRSASLTAARVALDLDLFEHARHDLDRARALRHRGTAEARVQAWHAEALWCLGVGRRSAGTRALRAGLRVVDEHRAALGATELRAQASSYAQDLARTGLSVAGRTGRAGQLLGWAERWRASALMLPPVLPPDDVALARDLSQLRALTQQLQEPGLDAAARRELQRQQVSLERAVRAQARLASAEPSTALVRPPGVGELAATLGERALVEYVDVGGRLAAVVVTGGRATLHWLGEVGPVAATVQVLRFALRRLSDPGTFPGSLEAADAAATLAAEQLDQRLLQPLRPRLQDRPLVVVPTGALHAVPWSCLPSCDGRPMSVSPSAALWLRAAKQLPRPGSGTILVAGPQLEQAEREARGVADRYRTAPVVLTGAQATVEAVAAALDGAGTAHIAAHAHFRADNPQFSSLRLADGPLTVYDLERIRRTPQRLVLAACQSGVSAVQPGDELMGLTAALLSLGTQVLVASVLDVDDAATHDLMLALHDGLSAGRDVSDALVAAQQQVSAAGAGARATARSFVCFGAG